MPPFREEDADGDDGGAVGKVPRLRRRSSVIPYHRPAPPPEQPRLLSGIVSGARWLLSAVFASSSDSSDSSCSCSCSDHDSSEAPSDGEEYRHASDIEGDLDQTGKKMELLEDKTADHPPLASIGSSKLLVEKLICQEIFTRNECNRLIEMVQSRVVDSPKVYENCPSHGKLLSRTACRDAASPKVMGLDWSFEPNWKSPVADSRLHTLSPRHLSDQGQSPEPCDRAVMEAKRWIEEKRSFSKFNDDLSCGPCTLNTEMHRYDSDSDRGSSDALTKSNMHSLPPWHSPKMMIAGFGAKPIEPFFEKHKYLDSVNSTISSSGSIHGDTPSSGLWNTPNVTQSWQRQAKESVSLSSLSMHSDFSDGKLDNGYFPVTSRTNRLIPETPHRTRYSCIERDNNLLDVCNKPYMDAPKKGSSGAENTLKKKPFLDCGLAREAGTPTPVNAEISREVSNVMYVESCRTTEEKVGSTSNDSHNTSALVETSYVLDAEPISMVSLSGKVYFSRPSGELSASASDAHSKTYHRKTVRSIKNIVRDNEASNKVLRLRKKSFSKALAIILLSVVYTQLCR